MKRKVPEYEEGSGNWNVAASYADLIMFWIAESDKYVTIAEFGDMDFDTTLYMKEEDKQFRRLEALKRLVHALQMLINNTKFAVIKDDDDNVKKIEEDLLKIKGFIPDSLIMTDDGDILTSKKLLFFILSGLKQIKEDIKVPLNNAELIFRAGEEPFDPVTWKEQVRERFVNTG